MTETPAPSLPEPPPIRFTAETRAARAPMRPRWLPALLTALAAALLAGVAGTLALADTDDAAGPVRQAGPKLSVLTVPAALARHPTSAVTVVPRAVSAAMPSGFLGLSLEYNALLPYAGHDPRTLDPLLVRLIGALNPGQRPVLRIGGYSADRSWWPVPGLRRPNGIRYTLTSRWASVARALARALDARFILDINLEQGKPRVSAEMGRQLVRRIGARWIEALEVGNEPTSYSKLPYYHQGRHYFYARPAGYDFADYAREWAAAVSVLPRLPLAGPATGGFPWLGTFMALVARDPQLAMVTLHRYPLNRCFTSPDSARAATIPNLLGRHADAAMIGSLPGYAAQAHASGRPLRVDELNSVACSGKTGVSDTFASALWSLDALFSLFRAGVDGVNLHTLPRAAYAPFRLWRTPVGWAGEVKPLYYGLLMFSRAAPPGSRLLSLVPSAPASLGSWATLDRGGRIRLVLVNDSPSRREVVRLVVPAAGWGMVERLTAPGPSARTGVQLGGQSFGGTTHTARLRGRQQVGLLPRRAGAYELELPPASAALVTFAAAPSAGNPRSL